MIIFILGYFLGLTLTNPMMALPKLKKGPTQQRMYLTISLIIAKFVFESGS